MKNQVLSYMVDKGCAKKTSHFTYYSTKWLTEEIDNNRTFIHYIKVAFTIYHILYHELFLVFISTRRDQYMFKYEKST